MDQEGCYHPALCWDCKNALGKCSWSQRFEPIEGWTAEYDSKKDSYHVTDCLLFERDALNGGTRRLSARKHA